MTTRFWLSSLMFSITMLLSIPVQAETRIGQNTAILSSTLNRSAPLSLSPNDLAFLAYRGAFAAQGIPSYGAFSHAYAAQHFTAHDLVKLAVEQGKLPPEALSDTSYLNVVEMKIRGLSQE